MTQVSGRAGRGEEPGTVIIQTVNPEDYSLKAAADGDYGEFYAKEIEFRRAMNYPPFCSVCRLRAAGRDDRKIYDFLDGLRTVMLKYASDNGLAAEVIGPAREPVPKINESYRWQLIIKADRRPTAVSLLSGIYGKIKPAAGIRLATVFDN